MYVSYYREKPYKSELREEKIYTHTKLVSRLEKPINYYRLIIIHVSFFVVPPFVGFG